MDRPGSIVDELSPALRAHFKDYDHPDPAVRERVREAVTGPARLVAKGILAELTLRELIVLHLWRFFDGRPGNELA
jgi:hypothetical protein